MFYEIVLEKNVVVILKYEFYTNVCLFVMLSRFKRKQSSDFFRILMLDFVVAPQSSITVLLAKGFTLNSFE